MKKTILLLTSLTAAWLTFSSNSFGPANAGNGNRTGSNGGATCAAGGCHQSSANTTGSFVSITNLSNNQAATTYTPGQTYKIKFQGNNTSLANWGFQVFSGNSSNTGLGTINPTMTNTHIAPGNAAIIEHQGSLSKTNNMFEGEFEWTAPVSGSGPVTFYGIINAVNNNGNTSGDAVSSTFNSITLTEATSNISNINNDAFATAFPNPTMGNITLQLSATGNCNVKAYDLTGRLCYQGKMDTQAMQIPSSTWANGTYFIQLSSKEGNKVLTVVKQ